MKKTWIVVALVCLAFWATAQGSFKNLRYDEDYSFLKDSVKRSEYNNLKFHPLNKDHSSWLSSGGEVRFQYFHYTNEEWGNAPADDDGFILARILMHTDLHINKSLRVFGQVQSSLAEGRVSATSPVEQNELDLHQLFFDVPVFTNAGSSIVFRGGRQELNYGSSRLISVREGPNNRQSFDAAKVMFQTNSYGVDIFYGTYVASKKGIFNDEFFNDATKLWGVYLTKHAIPVLQNVDVYYLGLEKEKSAWSDVVGKELRHSVGTRISGKKNKWQYDFEGVYQFGDLGGSVISAWTLSSNTTYALGRSAASAFAGLKTEVISGDYNQDDGRIQSFNPLYPRGAYFGYAALIGPSNLFDIHPSIGVPVAKKFLASVDYDIFWRYSKNDGIYSPGAQVIFPAGTSNESFIGHQISGTLEFTGSKFIYLRAEITWFVPGAYIESMSAGKNILFAGLTSTFRF